VHDQTHIKELSAPGLATIMASKNATAKLIGSALGLTLPTQPGVAVFGPNALIGIGPGAWLMRVDDPPASWPADLCASLAGLASVSDQSGGYRIFRLSGKAARFILQKGSSIDLHPQAFPASSVATTVIAHIPVVIIMIDETPTYDLLVFRSYAESFLAWERQASKAASLDSTANQSPKSDPVSIQSYPPDRTLSRCVSSC
jgi:sarcosine oxidase subunit gamma